MIDSFHGRNNRRKSFDDTNYYFSMISHGEDNWLNFMKPFYYVEVKLTLKVKKEFKKYNFSYFIF